MYCKKCGAKITDGSMFCPACGVKVDYSEQNTDEVKSEPVAAAGIPEKNKADSSAHNFAVASLVLGIIGVCLPFLVPSILAIVFGSVSWRKNGGRKMGMATAGFVLGWVSLAISIVVIVLIAVFAGMVVSAVTNGIFFGSGIPFTMS